GHQYRWMILSKRSVIVHQQCFWNVVQQGFVRHNLCAFWQSQRRGKLFIEYLTVIFYYLQCQVEVRQLQFATDNIIPSDHSFVKKLIDVVDTLLCQLDILLIDIFLIEQLVQIQVITQDQKFDILLVRLIIELHQFLLQSLRFDTIFDQTTFPNQLACLHGKRIPEVRHIYSCRVGKIFVDDMCIAQIICLQSGTE